MAAILNFKMFDMQKSSIFIPLAMFYNLLI